jgi:imidazole glycerol-phosphate synthase subunit HisF
MKTFINYNSMQFRRVIPVILIHKGLLYKSRKFKDHKYVGDPINAVRIFNEKEVDEIVVIDIDASKSGKEPNYAQINEIAGEAFMPMAYGGGINHIDHVKKTIDQGVEKVIFSSASYFNPSLIEEAANQIGSSSTVVCIDARRKFFGGYEFCTLNNSKSTGKEVLAFAKEMESRGAGELIINSIDRDGIMEGYDETLIRAVTSSVTIPVVALGGAGSLSHLKSAFDAGANAAAAGSMFVFHGKHRAVLITYPNNSEINSLLYE